MTPERWREVEALFDDVVDLSAAERAAVLHARCAGDAELRGEVEALLASSARVEGLFEAPPTRMARAAVLETSSERDHVPPGAIIGAYRVVRLLGRGGMGAVYLAERADGHFLKQVALKIVKRGMDTDEVIARFRRERQILARLQHPNIAGLYDGGVTPNGMPYFVMELAEGDPIDRWCDARRCSIEARIELFITVCEAVQYAHRNLIVHRDLKPSNIVVCAGGEAKLLDFGIAKVMAEGEQDGPQITRMFARRLTPEYAAPEQVGGEATTTATDVYSLGVVLYELLTGQLPYGAKTVPPAAPGWTDPKPPSTRVPRTRDETGEETARIADARGTQPDALRQKLTGDLDAIVLMALQEEPERRYATAAALADDLRRHLNGEAVAARPDTQLYRWSRFVRRNRKTVTLAGSAVLALFLGMIGTGWQARIATLARDAQREEAAQATAARDMLVGLFERLNPDQLQGDTLFTRDEILAMGLADVRRLEGRPLLQAGVLNTLGQVAFSLGDLDGAYGLFDQAYKGLTDYGSVPERATSLMGMGEVLRLRFQFDDAEGLFREALEIRESTLAPTHPDRARAQLRLAFLFYNQSEQGGERSLDRAQALYDEALTFDGDARDEIRGSAYEGLADIAMARARLAAGAGDAAGQEGALAQAVTLYRQAIASYEVAYGPDHPVVAVAERALAQTLNSAKAYDEAEKLVRPALEALTRTYGGDHPRILEAHYILGLALVGKKQNAEAETHFRMAAAMCEAVYPEGHVYTAISWHSLGSSQLDRDDVSGALASLERAGVEYERVVAAGTLPETPASYHTVIGRALVAGGQWRDAIGHLRQAEPTQARLASGDGIVTLEALATAYAGLGMADSAAYFRQRHAAETSGAGDRLTLRR
jgi:serine/threonine-protein kinase